MCVGFIGVENDDGPQLKSRTKSQFQLTFIFCRWLCRKRIWLCLGIECTALCVVRDVVYEYCCVSQEMGGCCVDADV